MLTTIELENYRGFEQYRLTGLSRVNLLVGKNNCGKTSVLEAVHLLVSGGDFGVLTGTAWERGEVGFAVMDRETHRREPYPILSHFFYGHSLNPGAYFALRSSDGPGEITVRVVNLADLDEQKPLFEEEGSSFEEARELRATLGIRVEGAAHSGMLGGTEFPVTEDGAVSPDVFYRYRRSPRPRERQVPPVQFITPDSLEPRSMNEMWNKVIAEGRETEVVEAMRILAPGLNNIFFLSGETSLRFGGRGGVVAAFEGTKRRHPLGSYGGGMRRLLALSLSLVGSESGVLLVDEIDTGLHYSIMGDMWRLVTEAAKRGQVQVFATTHSSDCVRGLAWLCENHPQLRHEVSVQKIDCDLPEAVALDADQIILAVNQGMEVR